MNKKCERCNQCGGRVTLPKKYFYMGQRNYSKKPSYTAYGPQIAISQGMPTPGTNGRYMGPNLSFSVGFGHMGGARKTTKKKRKNKKKSTVKKQQQRKSKI